jgi:hypothetical protein
MSDDIDKQIRSLIHSLEVDYFGVADLSSVHEFWPREEKGLPGTREQSPAE